MNKAERLTAWRNVLDRALQGDYGDSRVLPAFHHTCRAVSEFPAAYFHDLMAGAEMDLSSQAVSDFDLLGRYCYCVAGTVGLCCVHVFGFRGS